MKSRIPLKRYLSLHFGTVAILPVVIIFFLVWFFMMPAIQIRTEIQHQTMARSIAGHISAYLEGGARQLTALSEYFQNQAFDSGQTAVDLLDAQCGDGRFFEALFVIEAENGTVKAVGLARSRRQNRDDYMVLDLSGRGLTSLLNSPKKVVWSETFLSTVSSRMAVALSVPLDGGSIIGEIPLGNLAEFIGLLPVESEFLTLVIDGQGLIVADSQRQRSGQVLNVNYPSAENGGIQSASAAFVLDGVKMLGTVVEMDAVGWKVLFAQPAKQAFQPLRHTLALIGLGVALALGLALFIVWFLAGNLTVLFASYAEKAESIANGRYNLQWPAARTKEFFQLSQSLQRMAEKINRREKALVDSEARLRDLVANVPSVVYQFKADPKAFESSSLTSVVRERSMEVFGLDTEQEKFFSNFVHCLPADDQSRFVKSVKTVLETAAPWYYEGRFTKPSGEKIWFEGRSVPRRIDGELIYYGVLTDITRRKEMESILRITQFSFDNANIGIYRIAPDARIIQVNQKAAQLLGYTKQEMEALSILDIDTLVTRETWGLVWQDLLERRTQAFEREHRRKDGSVMPVDVYGSLLEYEGQQYSIAFVQDITKRKQMEQALKESEQRLDLALSGANEGIWDWRIPEDILYLDSRYYTIAGYRPNEFPCIFDEILKRIHKDDVSRVQSVISRYLAGDLEIFEVAFRFLRKDGSHMWIQDKGKIVDWDDEGHPRRFIGTHTDITERKQAEEALRENEQLLANILESMNEGVFVLDSEFKNKIYNKGMEAITNIPREDVLGRRPWEVFSYIKNSPVEENIRKAMKGEVDGCMEVQTSHPHNPDVWSLDSFSPVKDTDGCIIGVVGVLSDITRQKQDEEALRRLRNYLSNIIDSMPSILVAVDRDGKVTQWNRGTELATGLSFEDACSQQLTQVFPRLADEMDRIQTSIRERRVINTPKVSRKVAQEVRYEDITIFPLVANGVEGAVIRVDDVTQQVRLEEMMIQSEKMLSVGGLAAGMAHEINNPLAGILQNASVLENRLLGDLPANRNAAEAAGITLAAIRHYMELRRLPDMIGSICESGTRAAAIVRNMLSFARKSDRVVSSQDLGVLLDQTLELVRTDYDMKTHYDFKHIHIERAYDPAAPLVPCEAGKLQQVFMNILKNGAQAMAEVKDAPTPPTFVLRVKDDGAWVRVEIEDNGPGMDEKIRRRIFEPFFTTKPVGKGTGLGLSVSYFIVTEDHGGEMRVQAADGGGTRFVIRLPRAGSA